MIVFILDDVAELTANYHSGGGLVVVARDLEHAKQLYADSDEGASGPTEEEWAAARVLPLVEEEEPSVHVHPDAGCC